MPGSCARDTVSEPALVVSDLDIITRISQGPSYLLGAQSSDLLGRGIME
jgi:hypothetical protein